MLCLLDGCPREVEQFLLADVHPLCLQLSGHEALQHQDALLLGELLVEDAVVTATPVLLCDEAGLLPIVAEQLDAVQEGIGIPLPQVVEHHEPVRQPDGLVVHVPCCACVSLRQEHVLGGVVGE